MIKRLRSYTSYSEENGKLVPSIEPHLVQSFEKSPKRDPKQLKENLNQKATKEKPADSK